MVHIKKIFTLGKDPVYEKGIKCYNKSEYEKAIGIFEDILSQKRYRSTLHYGLSEFYASQCYRNLGIIAMHEARFKDAIKYFEKSLKILPKATVLRNYLGICYNNVGLYNEAITEFEKVVNEKEDGIQINVRLALAYYNKGDHNSAIQKLKTTIASKPKHADLRHLLGLVLCNINDYEAGINEFSKAIEINPAYVEALRKLGLAYAAIEKYEDAKNVFQNLVNTVSDEDIGHYCLALTHSILGEPDKASKEFKKAKELNPSLEVKKVPSKSTAMHTLADKAGDEFSKAIMISSTFSSILTPLESAVKDIGLYNTLVRIYNSILEDHPNYADFHYKLGQVYENLHKRQQAIDEFMKAIELNPNYMHAHTSLAFAYKEKGDVYKAIEQFQFVLDKQTEVPGIYFQLALLHKEKGNRDKAIELLAKALELKPEFKDAKALLKELRSE